MAAPTCVITIIKRFTYRGSPAEEWSNTYALSGATPADATAWRALLDDINLHTRVLYTASTSVVAAYGYDRVPAAGDHAVWSVDLTVAPNSPSPGNMTPTVKMAGDQAAWIRWKLTRLTSKGKPIYLRKYFHDGNVASGGGDALAASYITSLDGVGTFFTDGTMVGGRKICDRLGEIPTVHGVSSYVTTRTLKRRGKRPPT